MASMPEAVTGVFAPTAVTRICQGLDAVLVSCSPFRVL
jgi:hypothetical protein